MMEKLKQVESTRSYISFFNYHAVKLIEKSKQSNLFLSSFSFERYAL